jgi:transposase InsO family protein
LIKKAYAMDVRKGRISRTLFQRGTTKQKEYWNSFIQMCVAQYHHPPLDEYVYYVSFIDDYSRKTWIYFLKSKDEVFSKFKEFKALIENLSERKIKILRSDNGGEYTSKEFVNFCRDVGIKKELTTPYNPQQNNVAERKNRTIMEVVKTMIHDQDLPMCLWAEATMAVVYVQNRLSHSALGFKTSEEMFT